MARPSSYAFRPEAQGSILTAHHTYDEPTAQEWECAMGYMAGTTVAPSLTEQDRRALLGRAMDANTLSATLAIALAFARWGG